MEPCPADSTKRSRSGQAGSAAENFRNCANRTVAASAIPIGRPGWPHFAASTASMASARSALASWRTRAGSRAGSGAGARVLGVMAVMSIGTKARPEALASRCAVRQGLSVDPLSLRGLRSLAFRERTNMVDLADAQGRLATALDRLESALTPFGDAQRRHVRDAAEIASLAQEREGLLARIAELEEETRSLASTTEEVENRLDGAIADIRAALGR